MPCGDLRPPACSIPRRANLCGQGTSCVQLLGAALRRALEPPFPVSTMLSNSWIMRAVAPQIISPETSKNHTAKESSSVPGIARPGMLQRSSWKIPGSASSANDDVEDALHLDRARHQVRPRRSGGEHRHDERGRDHGQDGVDPADGRHQGRVEGDLLVGLAQRRGGRVLPLVQPPAREADLALVRPQARGAPGQDQAGLALLLEERRPGPRR